jgi:hypothetical protein
MSTGTHAKSYEMLASYTMLVLGDGSRLLHFRRVLSFRRMFRTRRMFS